MTLFLRYLFIKGSINSYRQTTKFDPSKENKKRKLDQAQTSPTPGGKGKGKSTSPGGKGGENENKKKKKQHVQEAEVDAQAILTAIEQNLHNGERNEEPVKTLYHLTFDKLLECIRFKKKKDIPEWMQVLQDDVVAVHKHFSGSDGGALEIDVFNMVIYI
jgi:hypothetical protein